MAHTGNDDTPREGESARNPGLTVTVVICSYTRDRWSELLAAVDSVRMQTLQPIQTIVVIDHNPWLFDLARNRIGGHGSPVRVIESTGPKGLSGARNTGVEAATGDIVAFLDDDAFADRRWLEHLVAAYADETVVAAGGRIGAPRE
ncbi:glycosyltransferase family 2 protein, partial [bacterium]|nr:glycosyltransferase family 2 protein [bacterium]